MLDPNAAHTRCDLGVGSAGQPPNLLAEHPPFSHSSDATVRRSHHGRLALADTAADPSFHQIFELPLIGRPSDATTAPVRNKASVSTFPCGAIVKRSAIENDAQQRVKEATNKELAEMDAACSLATHNSSLGQGKSTSLWNAVRTEQRLRQVTTLLTGLEIQQGQTRHNWNTLQTPKAILPSIEELVAIDTLKTRQFETKLFNLRTHIDTHKLPGQSDIDYLGDLLHYAGAQFEPLSAQWLKELLKYVLSPRQDVPPAALEDASLSVEFLESAEPNLPHTASFAPLSSALQESGLVELAQSILAAAATHMCAGANLGAHANALLEKHRFDPEKGTLVTSSQFLIEMSQLFKTRIFAWWPQGIDLNSNTAALSQTMHQAIEQHLGENPRNAFRETFQTALAKLNSFHADLRSHTLFHPLENSDVFQL